MKNSTIVPILGEKDTKLTMMQGALLYKDLRETVTKDGILDRDYFFYASLYIVSMLGFLFSAFLLLFKFTTPFAPVYLILFMIFGIQLAGLFHDAGHRAIFKSARNNDILGYITAFTANMGFSYWKYKHNKHHANPNEIDNDPDIDIPLFSFTKRKKQQNFATRALLKYQAYLYYPLGSTALLFERYKSLVFMKDKFKPLMVFEMISLAIGAFFWYILPFLVLTPIQAVIFLLLTNLGVGIYMANIFAPNHKGMPQIEKGAKISFLEQQVRTARNITPGLFVDTFYVGLNYQTEHHLFPNCPRRKLGRITPHLKQLCEKMGVEYTETGILESNKIILSDLSSVGHYA